MLISRREFLQTSMLAGGTMLAADLVSSAVAGRAAAASRDRTVLARAVRFEIHPTVAIARVGNSADSFYFGPEVPGATPKPTEGFKDASGAMAKQAARFRIYAYGPSGEVLGELPHGVAVQWTVTVANKKAAWYESSVAMDISVAQPVNRRNPTVTNARDSLAASVCRSVSGSNAGPVELSGPVVFDNQINFGEIFTDAASRLIFLPGDGRAYPAPGAMITTFADNDGWSDNICDGVVQATVSFGGRRIPAIGAYVIVTPPNYGPAIAEGPITLLDQVRSPLTLAGQLPLEPVSFREHILPLLQRLVDLQWVNAGVFTLTRPGKEMDWLSATSLRQLADPSSRSEPARRRIAGMFRNPAYQSSTVQEQPLLLGDGTRVPPTNQYSWLSITTLQYLQLQAWARGDFHAGSSPPVATSVDDLPLSTRPGALDEASLDSVLGGANHPGVETPWVLRVPSMWDSPYRLRVESTTMVVRDYGPQLTPAVTLGPNGPVHGVSPGDITMWMGVPWHADAASCRNGYRTAGYAPNISPYLPTFWPARVPNEVLAEADYREVMDTTKPLADRQAAFARRRTWIRPLAVLPTAVQQLTQFVSIWPSLGIVNDKPGPPDRRFPSRFKVETEASFIEPPPSPATTYACSATAGLMCPIEW